MAYTVSNTFASQSGNVPASQIDANFTSVLAGVNNAFLVGTLAARPAPDGVGSGRYYFATDDNGGTLYRDNGTSWIKVSPGVSSTTIWTDQLTGLGLSAPGGNTTLTIAAGLAASDDATIANRISMTLGAFTKTMGAWTVGSGNGGLDAGAIAGTTTYHVFVIERVDTSVVDVLISLSATAPTMPANYTKKRRIGSIRTDATPNILGFVQYGDEFYWLTPPADDVDATNPGTGAVTRTLTVPTGIQVLAIMNVVVNNVSNNNVALYLSSLDAADVAAANAATPLGTIIGGPAAAAAMTGAQARVWTNTLGQIRSRLSASGAGDVLRICPIGWLDRRGRA